MIPFPLKKGAHISLLLIGGSQCHDDESDVGIIEC